VKWQYVAAECEETPQIPSSLELSDAKDGKCPDHVVHNFRVFVPERLVFRGFSAWTATCLATTERQGGRQVLCRSTLWKL
jgi:hypothetical protein